MLEVKPLTPDRWADLSQLFGPRGAVGGCWCMWNRQTQREYDAQKGERNRAAFRNIVGEGRPPGLIAYDGETPVGWISLGPREDFGRIQRSPITKPVDDVPTWSIVCFFIPRDRRGQGVGKVLLASAIQYARDEGATALEGYPIEPRSERMPSVYAWTGLASMFEAAGFSEIARRSPTRPVFRLDLTDEPEY